MDSKKTILEARSKRNGIVFYSNKNPFICYEVYIDEKGEIQKEQISRGLSEIKDEDLRNAEYSKKMKITEKRIKIAMAILGIISMILTKRVNIAFGIMYFSIIALKDLLYFTDSAYQLKCGRMQDLARFHSAEHMVSNAYTKVQRVPTIEEIKKASRFDRYCSSRIYINKILIFGMLSIVICLSGFIPMHIYLMLVAALFIFTIIQQKYNVFRFLQIFCTKKPTDREIEVAQEGIKFFEEMEEKMSNLFMGGGILLCFRCVDNEKEE